jgi:EAL domain-containing protein (putative c-di-GMP-specific phosphodiesterase class I)
MFFVEKSREQKRMNFSLAIDDFGVHFADY